MAAPAPPPANLAPVQAPLGPSRGKRSLPAVGSMLGWINRKGCGHSLRLRHSFKLDPRMRMELGADLDIDDLDSHGMAGMLRSASPWTAFWYELDAADASKGSLEMTPEWIAVNRTFTLGRKGSWYEVPIRASVGATYKGKPYTHFGIGNLPVALGLAVGLLAVGKTVSLQNTAVSLLSFEFSNGSLLQEGVEIDAQLRREGGGLRLDVQHLAGVLRVKQK